MYSHPLARLTPISRERLIQRHIDQGIPLLDLAVQAGISLHTAYKWLARVLQGDSAALADRRSVRRTQRRTLDPQQLQRALDLQHERCTLRRFARALTALLSTVAIVLKAMGLGRLKNLQPAEPLRRYEWAHPGDMILVDIKLHASFERIGHRITCDQRLGSSRGAGYEKAHVAADDATRLAYREVLPDKKQETTAGFLLRL
jgi:transposase